MGLTELIGRPPLTRIAPPADAREHEGDRTSASGHVQPLVTVRYDRR